MLWSIDAAHSQIQFSAKHLGISTVRGTFESFEGHIEEEDGNVSEVTVEVDEPEPDTVPLIGSAGASVDADDTEVAVERMTEEELLKGLEGLAPPEEQPEEDE